MLTLRALIFSSVLCCFAAPAQAGLFSDDEARNQIKQLEARVNQLQEDTKQQMDAASAQHTQVILDMQTQIDALKSEIRDLRGQNEELAHGLQDAEKREKDFYVDLDTRLRQLETAAKEQAAQAASQAAAAAAAVPTDPFDPAPANRAFEAAYKLFKDGNYENAAVALQEFLQKFPTSAYLADANYLLGDAQFALKDYQGALDTYQGLLKSDPGYSRAPDVLYNMAGCQQELKQPATAKKTLKQLVAKYPDSEAGIKAKQLLGAAK